MNAMISKAQCVELADKLEAMVKDANHGRGMPFLNMAIFHLREGKFDEARHICMYDSDKFSCYRAKDIEVRAWLNEVGLLEDIDFSKWQGQNDEVDSDELGQS